MSSRRAPASSTARPFKAVIFDAYGTLLRNDDLVLIPRRIVADHGLSARIEEVWRAWSELYFEATQLAPFRTLREIEAQILPRVLRQFDVGADAAPYVELFFQVTTTIELYPETREVLNALGRVRSAIVSNADHEDDVKGAKEAGLRVAWVNRDGRARRPDVPPPDFEIRDLSQLLLLLRHN